MLLSFFRSRRDGTTEVVPSEHEFFRRFDKLRPQRAVFDAQGELHSEIDLRLVTKLEEYLVPKLGSWEQTDRWFHQIDFYGDGVRSLTFRRDIFPASQLPGLQALLSGEHADFTILCCLTDSLLDGAASASKRKNDYVAIWRSSLLATRGIANGLSRAA